MKLVCRYLLVAAAALVLPGQVWALTCSVSTVGVNFGNYDVFNNTNLDSTGSVHVACLVSLPYSIAFSPGNGSYAQRQMLRGPYTLNYNLYTTASRTTVWGDGTGGTSTLNGLAFGATHTVYATVPARQNVRVGQYTDNIIVTLTF